MKKKIRLIVVRTLTCLAVIVFILACCSMDSEAIWIPLTALGVSSTWLGLVAWANGWIYGTKEYWERVGKNEHVDK